MIPLTPYLARSGTASRAARGAAEGLPPGFVLEDETTGDDLPPGFVMEGPREKMSRVEAAAQGAVDGVTFNTSDEIAGFGRRAIEESKLQTPVNPELASRRSAWPSRMKRRNEDPARVTRAESARYMEGVEAAAEAGRETTGAVRANQQQAREDHPLSYAGGAVGGAVATLPVGGAIVKGGQGAVNVATRAAAAVPGARTAGNAAATVARPVTSAADRIGRIVTNTPLIGPILNAASKGVAPGAAYGAAAAAGEATDDRVMGAMEGVLPGAAGGAAFGAGSRMLMGPLGVLGSVFARNPDKKALATIAREMNKAGVTPQDAAARVRSYGAGGRPVFETAAEFMGPGNQGLQTALGNVTGPSKDKLAETFTASVRDMGRNLSNAAKKATGKDAERFHAEKAAHEDMRITRDAENYRAVEGPANRPNRPPREDWEFYMLRPREGAAFETPIAKRPRFHNYAGKVLDDAELDGDTFLATELRDFLAVVRNGQTPRKPLSTRAINEIDQRITDDLQKALKNEQGKQVRILNDLQAGIRALDDTTGLGDARAQSAVGFGAKDAFDEGRKAFRSGVDLEDVVFNLQDAAPEVQDAYLLGMVRSMSDALANQSNLGGLADAAKKIAATPAMREKLQLALPSTARGKLTANSKRFMEMLERVSKHTERARQTYGNSATAPRQAAIEEAEAATSSVGGDVLDFVGEVISRQPGRVMGRIGQAARNRVTRPGIYNPRINEALGDRLGATGRRDILAVLDEIDAWNNRRIPLSSDRVDGLAARGGGFMAGREAGAASAYGNDAAGTQAGQIVDAFERDLVGEYFAASTSEERRAEIEAMFGEDAADLRALLNGATVN